LLGARFVVTVRRPGRTISSVRLTFSKPWTVSSNGAGREVFASSPHPIIVRELLYEVIESPDFPGHWHVEAIDDEGRIFVAVFSGVDADSGLRRPGEKGGE
jgi:hypothetical protein